MAKGLINDIGLINEFTQSGRIFFPASRYISFKKAQFYSHYANLAREKLAAGR